MAIASARGGARAYAAPTLSSLRDAQTLSDFPHLRAYAKWTRMTPDHAHHGIHRLPQVRVAA